MTIYVNSLGCGEGKTTQHIYPQIAQLLGERERVLLVVPSIKLQRQYAREFNTITVINSDNSTNVAHSAYTALENRNPFVCITHQAFVNLRISFQQKQDYHLIIDEVFDPYELVEFRVNNTVWTPDFRFDQVFQFDTETHPLDPTWLELNKSNPDPEHELLMSDSRRWQNLMHRNYRLWTTPVQYHRMLEGASDVICFVRELDAHIMEFWSTVTVAAAAFEHTFMSHWLRQANRAVETTHQFVPHKKHVRIHTPAQDFRWSRWRRQHNPEIVDQYHQYVKQHQTGSTLVLRNNDEIRQLTDEVRLLHNAHGSNDYSNINNISLESALNPSPELANFYTTHLAMTAGLIKQAFASYLFYQAVMRTSLRLANTTQPVDVFVLDTDAAVGLFEYFEVEPIEVLNHIHIEFEQKPKGRPSTDFDRQQYMREYMRKRRAKTS